MASKPEENSPAATEQTENASPAAPAEESTPAAETKPAADPEAAAKRKAERAEKRKEQRKASRQAAKEARAAGEAKPKAAKAAKSGDVPEGAAPKITVAKIPDSITTADLKAIFEPHGTILRAEVSRRKGRPTIGTIYFNTNAEVLSAMEALHGKHKCEGQEDPISIQYARDAKDWGDFVKKTTDDIAECLRQNGYKPGLLRSKDSKDFINRMLYTRRKAPATELLTAALLVFSGSASAEELAASKVVNSAAPVMQLLKDEKVKPLSAKAQAAAKAPASAKKEETKAASKIEKTFDAVVPRLDKLEKDRWNRMAKANLSFPERQRFRFVDILATPSLELWRWMVEDCRMSSAEAGTCFAILQNYYGFTK